MKIREVPKIGGKYAPITKDKYERWHNNANDNLWLDRLERGDLINSNSQVPPNSENQDDL